MSAEQSLHERPVPTGENSSNKQSKRSNTRIRNRARGDGETSGQNQSVRTRKPKSKSSRNDPTSDARFLQVSKLIKKFKPVTLNGVATRSIIEQVKEKEENDPMHFKNQYKNCERLSYLQKYLLEFVKHQPESILYISFIVKPSDPDFPFDLAKLKLNISIPPNYPADKTQTPTIVVLNEEIPRGFGVNIERGFKRIADIARGVVTDEEIELVDGSGLLSLVYTLDKYLELFLKQEKRETIKFVKTIKKKTAVEEKPASKPVVKQEVTQQHVSLTVAKEVIEGRNAYIEEMLSKLGSESVKLFKKSQQESRYKVTIPIVKGSNFTRIPSYWTKNKSVDVMVTVPIDYPQSELTISIPNNFSTNLIVKYGKDTEDQLTLVKLTKEYRQTEKNIVSNFNRFEFDTPSILVKINWITNNLGSFCLEEENFKTWQKNVDSLKAQLRQ